MATQLDMEYRVGKLSMYIVYKEKRREYKMRNIVSYIILLGHHPGRTFRPWESMFFSRKEEKLV